jgi:cytochrome c oxidase subunit 2
MASGPTIASTPGAEPNHARRVVIAWLVLSAIATPLVAVFVGPAIPPGNATTQATQQVFDNTWMLSALTPIICLLVVYFAYALARFRARPADGVVDGPPLRSDARIQVLWLASTSIVVLFFAGFGTYELLQNGAGGGQGPSPIAVPSGDKLQVQVIGQQWEFTYRYPSLGGFESNQLVLPEHTYVELHVTSLDVVHSFWAYEWGVKADANPGVDNVAYVQTKGPGTVHVRCAELCGLWHGYMFNTGRVVSAADFHAWAKGAQALYAPLRRYVPPYSHAYFPDPQRRAG